MSPICDKMLLNWLFRFRAFDQHPPPSAARIDLTERLSSCCLWFWANFSLRNFSPSKLHCRFSVFFGHRSNWDVVPKKRKKRNGPGLERLPPEWWKSTDTRQKKSFGQMFVCHCQATVVGVLEVEVSGCSLVPQVCAILNRWRGGTRTRVCLLAWLKWCTYCRCLKKHLKVSLIAVSVEQSIYLFLTRCCLLPILPRTLQRHPCPLGRQNYFNKDGDGRGSRVRI